MGRTVLDKAATRLPKGSVCLLLVAIVSSGIPRSAHAQTVAAQAEAQPKTASSTPFVIQGRITALEGTLLTLKTPDDYPGGRGAHAQFVIAGSSFRVDISRARVLLPDGRRADKLPLAVGDRVLMVLSGPDSESPAPGSPGSVVHFASIVERLAPGDKISTH
jgi:hypothetical protein